MAIAITDNEATAARRRIPLLIFADTAGVAWAGAVLGVKAQLSTNGGAETASTADIVRVAGLAHYVELTQAEANKTPGDRISARVVAATGRLEAISYAEITEDDVYAAGVTNASVDAVVADNFAAIPAAVEAALADNLALLATAASVAALPAAVEAVLVDNFAALPSAASIVTALRAETTLSAWGVTSQPVGGSTISYTERRNGASIGTRTAFFDSTGKPVGLTAVV